MPIRVIEIPKPISLVNYETKQPLTENGKPMEWTFETVLIRLMSNPVWQESFAGMRAQQSIVQAFASRDNDKMMLAEDDWKKLKEAAENPRVTIMVPDGQLVANGFGVHPSLAFQLVPLIAPIIEAKEK